MSIDSWTTVAKALLAYADLDQKKTLQLRKQLAWWKGWAAFLALNLAVSRAAANKSFGAILWLIWGLGAAAMCVMEVRTYRREKRELEGTK